VPICVLVFCSVVQCGDTVVQCGEVWCSVVQCGAVWCSVLQYVAVWSSVLQCCAVCIGVLQCVAVCCSVLQCVAVCCSVLQCFTVHCTVYTRLLQGGEDSQDALSKLQVIFHKRATNYRALLRKMNYIDTASYGSAPPCTHGTCEQMHCVMSRMTKSRHTPQDLAGNGSTGSLGSVGGPGKWNEIYKSFCATSIRPGKPPPKFQK